MCRLLARMVVFLGLVVVTVMALRLMAVSLVIMTLMIMCSVVMPFMVMALGLVVVALMVVYGSRFGTLRIVVSIAGTAVALTGRPCRAAQHNQKQFCSHIGLFYRFFRPNAVKVSQNRCNRVANSTCGNDLDGRRNGNRKKTIRLSAGRSPPDVKRYV